MPTKYSFGGLGNLFKCECGCSEFVLVENAKPERLKVYECVNCHEWWVARNPKIAQAVDPALADIQSAVEE